MSPSLARDSCAPDKGNEAQAKNPQTSPCEREKEVVEAHFLFVLSEYFLRYSCETLRENVLRFLSFILRDNFSRVFESLDTIIKSVMNGRLNFLRQMLIKTAKVVENEDNNPDSIIRPDIKFRGDFPNA